MLRRIERFRTCPRDELGRSSCLSAAIVAIALWLLLPVPTAAQGWNLLVGGGSLDGDCDLSDGDWSDEVLGWLVDRSHTDGPGSGNGRILMLDYSEWPECGDPGGDCYQFECLGAWVADHLCVTEEGLGGCVAADEQSTYDLIVQYDALWFGGGDQAQYVDHWSGTLTETAIHHVWSQGGTLGGTSAGAMMQSAVVSVGGAPSWEATADPYSATVDFVDDFLASATVVLEGITVDTHFVGRARLGRLAVSLARQLQDNGRDLVGLGVDTETGFALGPNRVGEVLGEGSVAVLHPTGDTSTTLVSGSPAHVGPLTTHFLTEGFRYDLDLRAVVSIPATAGEASLQARDFQSTDIDGADLDDVQLGSWWADGVAQPGSLWFGDLTLQSGSGALGGAVVTTRLEDDPDLRENRQGAPLWVLQEQAVNGLAVFTDGLLGSACSRVAANPDATLTAVPAGCPDEQSVVVVDCCRLEWVDQSTWDADGNGAHRQSAALTPCTTTLFNSQVGPAVYDAGCGVVIFGDGFESGDLGAWSSAVP